MSGKERVKISYKKEEEWENRASECFNELFNSVSGKLLTTMEVALPHGTQLEALKSRIKDVQGKEWDEMIQVERDVRNCCFEVDDSTPETKPTFEKYKERVEEFYALLEQRIRNNLHYFQKVVMNLTRLVIEDTAKQNALEEEISRIVSAEAVNRINRWLSLAVEEVFEIK